MDENNPSMSSSSSKNNIVTIVLVVGAVIILLLAGGVYAFRHQIRATIMPSQQAGSPMIPVGGGQTPEPSEPTVTDEVSVASDASTVGSDAEVDYGPSGFNPKTVTIKKGQTVKFFNESEGSTMEVASDPHPTHTDYPGFDQTKSDYADKQAYYFTFDKVGTWGYHNHLNPADMGKVIVTD